MESSGSSTPQYTSASGSCATCCEMRTVAPSGSMWHGRPALRMPCASAGLNGELYLAVAHPLRCHGIRHAVVELPAPVLALGPDQEFVDGHSSLCRRAHMGNVARANTLANDWEATRPGGGPAAIAGRGVRFCHVAEPRCRLLILPPRSTTRDASWRRRPAACRAGRTARRAAPGRSRRRP